MKKLILLGAGFSYDLGMPLVTELTSTFLGLFNDTAAARLVDVLSKNDPYSTGRPINRAAIQEGMEILLAYRRSGGTNYEELLSKLQIIGDLPRKSQSDRDSFHYLFAVLYDLLAEILVAYQYVSYDVLYSRALPLYSKFENLLNDHETWIFTLNHDLYLECLAIDLGVPATYGDLGEIVFPIDNVNSSKKFRFTTSTQDAFDRSSPGWFSGTRGLNIVRLHGGLAEYLYSDNSLLCNPPIRLTSSYELVESFRLIESMGYFHEGQRIRGGKDRIVTGPDGTLDIICRAMLTGGRKYSKTTNPKKGEEKLSLFEQVLRDTDELTIVGYGFGDPHVNYRISNAMVLNSEMRICIVDPVARSVPQSLEQFDYNMRVGSVRSRGPEWMSYARGETWDAAQSAALKANDRYRDEISRKVSRLLPR